MVIKINNTTLCIREGVGENKINEIIAKIQKPPKVGKTRVQAKNYCPAPCAEMVWRTSFDPNWEVGRCFSEWCGKNIKRGEGMYAQNYIPLGGINAD